MRSMFACVAALLLAGCANSSLGLSGSSGPVARPKTIVVSDFVFGDVTAIDRAYTVRLERKIGPFPPHERKPRTLERVNEEIVANVVAALRGAGLDAQPGGADSSAGEGMVLVTGILRGTEAAPPSDSKKPRPVTDQIGFGTGRPNVVAEVKVLSGRRTLTSFNAEAGGGRGQSAGNARQAAAQNSAIAAALVEQKAAPEKLSPEVEGHARRLGRNVADQVLAYAKEQGWLNAPAEVASAEPKE